MHKHKAQAANGEQCVMCIGRLKGARLVMARTFLNALCVFMDKVPTKKHVIISLKKFKLPK